MKCYDKTGKSDRSQVEGKKKRPGKINSPGRFEIIRSITSKRFAVFA
jgi:hypothetical protein